MKERENINSKLNNLKAPIDKKALWLDIQNDKDFPKQKRDRKRLFWFFGCIAILSLGSLGYSSFGLTNNENFSVESKISEPLPQTSEISHTSELKLHSNSEPSKDILKAESADTQQRSNNNIEDKTALNKKHTAGFSQRNEIKKTNKILDKNNSDITKEKPSSSPPFENNSSRPESENITLQEKSNLDSNQEENIIPSSNSSDNLVNQNNDLTEFETKHTEFIDNKVSETKNANNADYNNNVRISKIESFEAKLLLAERERATLNIAAKHLESDDLTTLVSLEKPKQWQVELATGIGSGFHQKQLKQDQELADFEFQNQNTKSIESLINSIRVKRKVKDLWTIGFGAQYYNSFQKMSHNTTSVEYIRQDSLSTPFYLKETNGKSYNLFQKHHFIDVQLLLQRDFRFKNNRINLGFGLGYNLKYSLTGKSLDLEENVFNLNEDDIYKTNLGHHYIIELGYQRSITDNLYLHSSIEIKSRIQLQKIQNDHTLIPYYFKLGLGYHF